MATNVAGITSAAWDQPNSASQLSKDGPESEVSKEMFLQLLVAQIKNQNPLDPMDGVEFLTQLAEFTGLEQMVGIRDEVAAIRGAMEAAASGPGEGASAQEPTDSEQE